MQFLHVYITLLPKDRIGHCHCKDIMMKSKGADYDWAAMGRGSVDWLGQFKALKRMVIVTL